MKKRNVIALSIFGVFYLTFGTLVTLNQERIIYQPFPQDFAACSSFTSAEKISHNGTRMYVNDITKPVVVLYHGNAGSACDRDFFARIFTQAGYGYVIVEYAGYSNDERRPSHDLIKNDVEQVVSYLNENNVEVTAVVGESIGTGVASYHALLSPPDKLLLLSPFTDLADIAKNRFWFYPTSLLVDNAYDNVTHLKNFQGVVTIIHGTNDNIIPYHLGRELFESIKTQKTFVTIDGGGHNDLFTSEATYSAINKFLSHE